MRDFIAQEVKRVERRFKRAGTVSCIATSGTAAALSDQWEAQQAGERLVPRAAVARLANQLAKMRLSQRRALVGIGPRRAEIIVAGSAVFAELMSRLELPSFRYSPLGLGDGLLEQMLADYDKSARVRRQIESERHDALLETSAHYGVDRRRAERIRDLCQQLFRELKPVHQLPPEYAEWLSAAEAGAPA